MKHYIWPATKIATESNREQDHNRDRAESEQRASRERAESKQRASRERAESEQRASRERAESREQRAIRDRAKCNCPGVQCVLAIFFCKLCSQMLAQFFLHSMWQVVLGIQAVLYCRSCLKFRVSTLYFILDLYFQTRFLCWVLKSQGLKSESQSFDILSRFGYRERRAYSCKC